ncbi:MAG: SixA phosphatase family protein [Lysobacteraceae bacterium]
MHRLILLRHAHAETPSSGITDRERPLTGVGHAEAGAAAQWLGSQGYAIDRVVHSDARRARETCARVLATVEVKRELEDGRIYEATPGELISVAEDHRKAGCVLMVGHNPGFEQLAALLTTGQTGDYRGMPPAGCAVIEFDDPAAPLEPGCGRLAAFWSP